MQNQDKANIVSTEKSGETMVTCMGCILEVNLSTKEIKKTQIPAEVYYNVLAGKGLGVWYCLRNIPAGADPLGPDNVLGFTSGALTGTGVFFTGRTTIVGKSPLTDGWGDANVGGIFAPAIKQCGVDAIFFKGVSDKPVYLYVDNETCELRDASNYWGLDATEAEQKLINDNWNKKKPCVALIGQAGEKLSHMAGICNEGGRIAARSGLGAVMGSKKLKAVVLAGSKPIKCADNEAVKEISKTIARKVKKANAPDVIKGTMMGLGGLLLGALPISFPLDGALSNMLLKRWGTPMNQPMASKSGDAPIKNWTGSREDIPNAVKEFDPDKTIKRETSKYHCYACPLGCGGMLDIRDIYNGQFKHTHKPEYETSNQFGPLSLNMDYDSIMYINELLNRAGMDSISCGSTVAFAIECYENGILTKQDTDGLELTWGNTYAIVELVKKIIARDGFGDVLADGSKIAAQRIGKGSENYAMHVGGSEPAAHDSRNDPGLALAYSVEPAPGKHTVAMDLMYNAMSLCDVCSWAPPVKVHPKTEDALPTEEMAMRSVANACYTMLVDGAGWCYYGEMMGVHTLKPIDYLNAASGWNRDGDDYFEIGKRIQTMRQMFNLKQGIDPVKVTLPKRMLGYPPLKAGPLKSVQLEHADEQRQMYWKCFGWDEKTAVPLESTIDKLGINKLLEMEV